MDHLLFHEYSLLLESVIGLRVSRHENLRPAHYDVSRFPSLRRG